MLNPHEESRPSRTTHGLLVAATLLALLLALFLPRTIHQAHCTNVHANVLAQSDVPVTAALGGNVNQPVAMGGATSLPPATRNESSSTLAGTNPDHPKSKKTTFPFYAEYLKNPASLGFEPDEALFEQVHLQIKAQHYGHDPESKLYQGVAAETRVLLKEASIPTEALDHMTVDQSLPRAIIKAYGTRLNNGLLWYAMIRGLLKGTDDPYSVLMTPREYRHLMEDMESETFGGIGIYIELDAKHNNQLTIAGPVEGTPAEKAGLLPGDEILRINGKPTAGMSLDAATTLIRGPVDTTVVLTIRRKGSPDRDYAITRSSIEVKSVSFKMLEHGLGYIRLRVFGEKTGQELQEALENLHKQGAKALILDLRNNGGGYITAAIDVCSHFIKRGALVTYVLHKDGSRRDYLGDDTVTRTTLPMVLLVNQYSASASEITTGCFKDYGVATVMGVKTFGKGSVQQLFPLPGGDNEHDPAALKLTIAHFFTPKGHAINKIGVEPNILVPMDPRLVGSKKDVQLEKAIEFFKSRGVI